MRLVLFFCIVSTLFATQVKLGDQILNVEIADTPSKWAKGLMGREHLFEGEGMLFVYPKAKRLSFWMKNTLVPLSIAFFDDEKSVINILDMDPPIGNTLIKYRSTAPARYALEVPQGWFDKHGVKRGTKFSFVDQP